MNNWLGFSLSPHQQLPSRDQYSQDSVAQLGFNSDEISGGTQVPAGCFDLTSDSSIPSLNQLPPPPFAILQAFSRNTDVDWNMKDVSVNSFSCNAQNPQLNQGPPKLENFLGVGGQSFADSQQPNKQLQANTVTSSTDYGHDHGYTNIYQESEPTSHTSGSTMGLSMIKNWLRNNPAPPQVSGDKVGGSEAASLQGAVVGAQTLSLSMSTGSSDGKLQQCGAAAADSSQSSGGAIESVPRKSIDTFGQRTSIYRGVTRHRWTGRFEAHLWDNSCRREGQTRKGRQVYLGGYDKEEKAARAYDLAALKYWGTTTTTNFPISNYEKEMEEMKLMTRQEYVASLRRKSSGFSRGASSYRGVTRHHQHGRWQARIGRVAGNKDLYLGTFSTQEEAAEAYDIAAIKFRGLNAVTNFEISRYDVKSILESSTLPIGGAAKRLKDAENGEMALDLEAQRADKGSLNLHLMDNEHLNGYGGGNSHQGWPSFAFQQAHPIASMYPYAQQRLWCKPEQDPDVGNGFNNIHHQLSTQNFLQPSVLHNLMSLDSCSSMGPNSVVYENNGGGFGVPMMSTVVVQDGNEQSQGGGDFVGNHQEEKPVGYDHEGIYGSGDPYQQARNLYYHQQGSSNGMAKASSLYSDHQDSTCNNWPIPTAVPALATRANTMAVCHGASTFTVWNDT